MLHPLGAGKAGATLKRDDSMEDVLRVMSHDSILFFTDDGIARSLKAYQIPEASRVAVGTAITQVRRRSRVQRGDHLDPDQGAHQSPCSCPSSRALSSQRRGLRTLELPRY